MYFLIGDDDLLENYNIIWDKVSADKKKELDSKRVHNKNFIKTRTKLFGNEATDFYDGLSPKVDSNHTCLAVIRFYFAL